MFAVDARMMHTDPDVASHREEILAWLSAHRLDPNLILAVKVLHRRIIVTGITRNQDGKILANDRWDGPKTHRYRVRLRKQPPMLGAI